METKSELNRIISAMVTLSEDATQEAHTRINAAHAATAALSLHAASK